MFIISPLIIQLSPPVEDKKGMRIYSTHNPYSKGCEGIYRVCGKLGVKASRYNFSTTFLRSIDKKVLVIIDDLSMASDKDSIEEMKQWVAKGNKVIYISKKLPVISFRLYDYIKPGKGYIKTKFGKGAFVFCSNPDLFTNKYLKKGAPLFVHMLRTASVTQNSGEIQFNEYIHGYGRNENVWDILPQWIKLSVIEILILFLGIMVMHGRRFGKPSVLEEDEKRSVLEYYDAVAMLYRRSGDYEAIVKEYFDVFCRKVTRKYGGNKHDYDAVKLVWKQRGIKKYDLLEECIDAIQKAMNGNMEEKAFKACITKIDELKKEIGA